MKWLCCCTCCWPSKDKTQALDDASSLIPDGHSVANNSTPVQDFYVPRRHSSFNTSTYTPVSVQPGRSQSDSCSSSGDEDAPPLEQRGRCWSTIPATSATDVTSLISPRPAIGREYPSYFNSRGMGSVPDLPDYKGFSFDRHLLPEISETEPGAEDSVDDDQKTDAEVYGFLAFTTAYDEQEQKLTVFLDQATDLPAKGTVPHYNTFVRLTLTSSRKNFRLSRAVRNCASPAYKEEHVFHTNRSKWKGSRYEVLRLSVYECERQGRHDAIGHAVLPLSRLDGEGEERHILPLTPASVPAKGIGQLLTGLFYSATQSKLSIHVIRARHLKMDNEIHKRYLRPLQKEIYDTFVKVTLMCAGQKVKTTRSRVAVDSPDPFYNHRSSFVVPPQFLLDSSLVVTVMLRGVLGRSAALGRVTAGPYTETAGVPTHWGRMSRDTRSVVLWRNLCL